MRALLVFLLSIPTMALAGELDAFRDACLKLEDNARGKGLFSVAQDTNKNVWGKCTLMAKGLSWSYYSTTASTVGKVRTLTSEETEQLKKACATNDRSGRLEIGADIPQYRLGESGDLTAAIIIWCHL